MIKIKSRSRRVYPFDTLLTGESFEVAYSISRYNSLRNCAAFHIERHGGNFSVQASKKDKKITVTKVSNSEAETK